MQEGTSEVYCTAWDIGWRGREGGGEAGREGEMEARGYANSIKTQ